MKTNLPLNPVKAIRVWLFLALLFMLNLACGGSQSSPTKSSGGPILVVIGEDLSGTFTKFTPITKEDLSAICDAISRSGLGGTVALFGIGTATPQGYITCKLNPLEKKKDNPTVHETVQWNDRKKIILQNNTAAIEIFLSRSDFKQKKTAVYRPQRLL
jgi:hypothetical protein